MCVPKAGALGLKIMTAHEYLPLTNSHVPPPPNVLSLNNRPPAAVFFTGTYVMVMGVIQAVSPEPVIRAVKMADLSELAALHRRMWKLEVEELQRLLA